jgi:hypothetical protein
VDLQIEIQEPVGESTWVLSSYPVLKAGQGRLGAQVAGIAGYPATLTIGDDFLEKRLSKVSW